MFTVVVLSLLYVGSANMYATKDFSKNVKKVIEDKERRKEVASEIESIRVIQAEMEEELTEQVLTFQAHYDSEKLDRKVLTRFFDDVELLYAEYYRNTAKDRHDIAQILTDTEWNQLVKRYQGEHEVVLKARKGREKLLEKEIDKFRDAISDADPDPEALRKANVILDRSQLSFLSFYEASNAINFVDNANLCKRSGTLDELNAVYDDWNVARSELYTDVVNDGLELSETFTDAEWQIIIEALKSKFK